MFNSCILFIICIIYTYIYILYIHIYIYILYIHIYIIHTYIYIYITLYYIHCCSVCNRKSVNLKLLTKPPADSLFWEDETDPRRLSSRSKRMGSNPRLVSSTIRKAFWMVSCQMLRDGMGRTSFCWTWRSYSFTIFYLSMNICPFSNNSKSSD